MLIIRLLCFKIKDINSLPTKTVIIILMLRLDISGIYNNIPHKRLLYILRIILQHWWNLVESYGGTQWTWDHVTKRSYKTSSIFCHAAIGSLATSALAALLSICTRPQHYPSSFLLSFL